MASTVFATTELLEQILLELPIKDILIDQRVSKAFHSTTIGSTKLQQALFFKPLPGPPLSFKTVGDTEEWLESPDDQMYHTVVANPIYHMFRVASKGWFNAFSHKDIATYRRPEASWRRMLVSQPPIIITASPKLDVSHKPLKRAQGPRYNGTVRLEYPGGKNDLAQEADGVNQGLRLGDVDERLPEECRADRTYWRTIIIDGAEHWKRIWFASEVERITEEKPDWLLRKEKGLPEPEPDFDDDYGYHDYEAPERYNW